MIVIKRFENGINIEGHAGYAEPGKDVVCAGVSALFQTFLASVEDLCTDEIKSDISANNAVIRYWDLTEQAQLLLNSFFIGIEMIANTHPAHVRIV